ncbi:Regulatory subunit of cAMP-dependent protein kinase [Spironucleus salmonicida]|uniref:Regulatory subunit of cAMP-dependent protein kinase n=1 Tax=Spironucleus salmonicida TaxID=348837 RepID=V6LL78_9EUKA|nr:Regulatory subunit of cAMP-dependent protein kinase [Spironucleus salmonicida]|eukprot:EST45123.1 hypothetical protein SS50377_15144 [Spironucleus salmonicida]
MNDTIYAAEQIIIPPTLPEILKNYSKAVLSEQPADLVDFSIKYFGMLKTTSPTPQKTTFQPNLDLLADIYKRIDGKSLGEQLQQIQAEVPSELIEQLQLWYKFGRENLNMTNESSITTLTLLFCLIYAQLYDVLQVAFFVFKIKAGYISKEILLQIFDILCKFDYRVEKNAIDIVKGLDADIFFDDLIRMLGVRK